MYRWKNNGGWNKQCGTVEYTPRIDSFDVQEIRGWGTLFAWWNGKILKFDCDHYTEYGAEEEADREIMELHHPKEGWCETLELSRKANGFGGNQTFFLCPACGARVRYLYQTGATFLCRKCARINYRSQQDTKSDSMYYYYKGMEFAELHFEWPHECPDGFTFCDWVPDRPRYMHESTYRRYLARFLRYRRQHEARQLEDLRRILGPQEYAKLLQTQNEN